LTTFNARLGARFCLDADDASRARSIPIDSDWASLPEAPRLAFDHDQPSKESPMHQQSPVTAPIAANTLARCAAAATSLCFALAACGGALGSEADNSVAPQATSPSALSQPTTQE
jgi:hypothetical protein